MVPPFRLLPSAGERRDAGTGWKAALVTPRDRAVRRWPADVRAGENPAAFHLDFAISLNTPAIYQLKRYAD